MSFTPERSNSGDIEAFSLLQSSIPQAIPVYLPLVILASPSVVIQILQVAMPSLQIPLSLINSFLIAPLISGAGIYFVYRYISTQTVDLDGSISQAIGKITNLILGFFLYLIAVVIGLCLLVIPGIYVAVRLGFVMYGVMIDDLDAVSALKSSWNLVEGRWFAVLGALLLPSICFLVPVLLASFIIGIVVGTKNILIASILGALVGLSITPFLTFYSTKLYLRLKELAA